MSEMALLAFSSMGGRSTNVRQIYVFVPKSLQGVDSGQETVILTSDARLYGIQGFDYDVAGKVLSRMGCDLYCALIRNKNTQVRQL